MNKLIKELAADAWVDDDHLDASGYTDLEKFAKSIVFDILGELTNDDTLGPARIETIRKLAERFGVSK